jgi:hypothetical protein
MFLFTTPTPRETAPATPVVEAIRDGAEKTGAGFDYLLATAQRESALDPGAKAKTSSATGLFQFIEQTWLGVLKQDGPNLGFDSYAKAIATNSDGRHSVPDPAARQAILELREDPKIASVMAGALTQRNREFLSSALGREPSRADLYVAHVLGPRGAADLIQMAQSTPQRPAASAFGEAAAANRSIFFDRTGRARNAGEVYSVLASHHGPSAAPAFYPNRPVTPARTDGPVLHGLFRTEGRTGPISESVARLWRTGATEQGVRTAALGGYFPRSATASTAAAIPSGAPVISAAPAAASSEGRTLKIVPLPPVRPAELRPAIREAAPLPPRRPVELGTVAQEPVAGGPPRARRT